MELKFQSKEESNRQQEEAWMRLTDAEKELRTCQLKELWKTLPVTSDFQK